MDIVNFSCRKLEEVACWCKICLLHTSKLLPDTKRRFRTRWAAVCGWEQTVEIEGSCHTAEVWSPHGVCSGSRQVQSMVLPTLLHAVSRSLSTRHNKHVMPFQRGLARRRKVVVVKLWGWCWAGWFQLLPTYCTCPTPGCARERLSAVRKVCSVVQPSPPPCEPSSGVTAGKPQPAEVVWVKAQERF